MIEDNAAHGDLCTCALCQQDDIMRSIPFVESPAPTLQYERPPSPTEKKDTNPKDAVGVRKARWFSYIPLRVLVGVGLALLEGARKYGRHNYRVAGVRASVYVDAVVCGHLMPWMEGEDLDPDTAELDEQGNPIPNTGLSHIDKAIASLVVLRDGMYEGNWVDDRPPSVKDWPAFIKAHHHLAGKIIDRYTPAVPAYTIADTRKDQ